MTTRFAKEKLPHGYRLAARIDLIKNRLQLLLVNGLAIVLMLLTIAAGIFLQPQGADNALRMTDDPWGFALKALAAALGMLIYIVGHEAVHGVCMWLCSRHEPHFGFSLAYAYAGSQLYFAKLPYMVIAIAPVVIWGILLGLLAVLLPAAWFWPVWIIQVTNISGAAGDFYVFARMIHQPASVLVQDTGTAMSLWKPA